MGVSMTNVGAAVYVATMVILQVHAASEIELTVQEVVRLDTVVHSAADGATADRYGDLIQPGRTVVRLEEGVYHFRTVRDADLRIADATAIEVVTPAFLTSDPKDPWPPALQAGSPGAEHGAVFSGRGAGRPDRVPVLSVSYGRIG
jgi:hypothetical protein